MEYVTWNDLINVGILIVSALTLFYSIYHNKRK